MHASLDAIRELYVMNIMSLKWARNQDPSNAKVTPPQFQVGDMVLIKNHYRDSPFGTKYIPSYRIIKLVNEHTADVQDTMDKIQRVKRNDVHFMLPSEYVLSHLLDSGTFGRVKKYINHPNIMPIWEDKGDTQSGPYAETPCNKILKHTYDLMSRGEKSYKNPGLQSS